MENPYKDDCFSIVESLLCDPWFDSQTLGKFNLETFGKLFPLDRTIFGIVLIYLMYSIQGRYWQIAKHRILVA